MSTDVLIAGCVNAEFRVEVTRSCCFLLSYGLTIRATSPWQLSLSNIDHLIYKFAEYPLLVLAKLLLFEAGPSDDVQMSISSSIIFPVI